MTTKIDIPQLRTEIRNMTPKQKIYRVLRDELSKVGHWKKKPPTKPNIDVDNAEET